MGGSPETWLKAGTGMLRKIEARGFRVEQTRQATRRVLDELMVDTAQRQSAVFDMPEWERLGLNARMSWLQNMQAQIDGS